MPITKQRTLDYVEYEWGTYVERFNRLPAAEQRQRVNAAGYETFRDLLAHVLAWWEEGMEIILAIAGDRPYERKKYDFDAFNAAAIAKYRPWEIGKFMEHFEAARQKMGADLQSLPEVVFENRRVKSWLYGAILHHPREHLLVLSRFLALDMLRNEWATYVADFNCLEPEKRQEFVAKQGVSTFHDLLAHIIGWWEETVRIVNGILHSPAFEWQEPETDSFNAELTRKFSAWSDEDVLRQYEIVRLALIDLIERLPQDAFLNTAIEDWLASDVVRHYDDHPMPG